MAKRNIHNPGTSPMFVGGIMIPPGDSRDVDEQYLPPAEAPDAAQAASEEPDPDANFRELLTAPLKELLPALGTHSDATLVALERLESAHAAPRKTLLAAIAALQLERAQAKTGAPT